jgi:hypothetical protein
MRNIIGLTAHKAPHSQSSTEEWMAASNINLDTAIQARLSGSVFFQ